MKGEYTTNLGLRLLAQCSTPADYLKILTEDVQHLTAWEKQIRDHSIMARVWLTPMGTGNPPFDPKSIRLIQEHLTQYYFLTGVIDPLNLCLDIPDKQERASLLHQDILFMLARLEESFLHLLQIIATTDEHNHTTAVESSAIFSYTEGWMKNKLPQLHSHLLSIFPPEQMHTIVNLILSQE